MVRRLLPAAVAALIGTILSAPPAAAFDPPTVNLTNGDKISQLQSVELTGIDNQVGSVRVSLGSLPEQLLLVEAHAASTTFETWGLAGSQPLVITQCDDAEGLDCDPAMSPINVVVDNPELTFTPSRPGTARTHDFDVTLDLDAPVTSGTPQLSAAIDDATPNLVAPGVQLPVDVDALADGPHTVSAAVCSADGTRCTTPATDPFTVVRSVTAGFSLDEPLFSPNGDTRLDTLTFTYSLVTPWDDGVIEIRDSEDTLVRSLNVTAPTLPDTEADLVYDGTDELAATLPEGAYTATLTARRTVDGELLTASYPLAFAIDLTVPPATDVAATLSALYPMQDGYLDSTEITWTEAESYARVAVEVRLAGGDRVRLMDDVASGVEWDGRDDDGDFVANGNYEIRVRVQDAVGNRSFSAPVPVTVSNKILVTRTKTITVTPQASVTDFNIGSCSRLKIPSAHGWAGSAGYLSNVRCKSTDPVKSNAWTIHRVTLPQVIEFRSIRLSWYGGPTKYEGKCKSKSVFCDTAYGTLYKADGVTAAKWTLSQDYLTTSNTPWVPAVDILQDHDVEWGFAANGGNRFDVKKFVIAYKADVLVNPG